MKYRVAVVIILALVALEWPLLIHAQEEVNRLEELESQIKILQRQQELSQEVSDQEKASAVKVSVSSDGINFTSADGATGLKIRGLIQSNTRTDFRGKESSSINSHYLRRVRPIFEGKFDKNIAFVLVPDFGGGKVVVQDAYLEWNLGVGALRSGKFKVPFGLERLQSSASTTFIELGLPSVLAPNYDTGVQWKGDLLTPQWTYTVGVFDGSLDSASLDDDTNNGKDIALRIFGNPLSGSEDDYHRDLGIGLAAGWGFHQGSTYPSYKTSAQATFFTFASTSGVTLDGPGFRLAPQAYYYQDNWGVLSEYVTSEQQYAKSGVSRTFKNSGFQVVSSYVLTGETTSYKGITPLAPFDLDKGQWGALELKARYGEVVLDTALFSSGFASSTSYANKATQIGFGANWILSKNVKWSLDYETTYFAGGSTNGDRDAENLLLTQFQLQF